MTDNNKNETLTFLIFSLPDDEEQAKDPKQSVVHYTTMLLKLSKEESLLFTACTEKTIFYHDEYNTRGGGTKSVFVDYLLGRYSKDGEADWTRRVVTPALSGVDSFWNDEIVTRCKKLPKHDALIAAPIIKETYESGGDYIDSMEVLFFEWKEMIAKRKENNLSTFEMAVLALDINDFLEEEEKSEEHAYNEDAPISSSSNSKQHKEEN